MPGLEDKPGGQTVSETTPSMADERTAPVSPLSTAGRFDVPVWMWPVAALVIIVLLITLYALM
jgi:hypothetical protein